VTLTAEPRPTTATTIADRSADIHQRLLEQQATVDQLRADLINTSGDEADRAVASLLLDEQIALVASLEDQLDDLAAAATRGDDYGVCERCGGRIPAERLAIFPATTMCVGCKGASARR
jgi:RNA polymerase-binding transcription factor DksA